MVSPDTNRMHSFAGDQISLAGRAPTVPTCREQILAALASLSCESGDAAFHARDVYANMADLGTRYAETTVFKTMQRMKELPPRPPYARLERVGRGGFRLMATST